jgi:Subtilase family
MRRVRRLVIAACCGVLAVQAGTVTTARSSTTTPPAVDLGALGLPVEQTVASVVAGAVSTLDTFRPAGHGIRVALISSGVSTAVLPQSLQSQVTLLGSGGDPAGYGTYAASVLLQLDPTAQITSIGVYPNGRFDAGWQSSALNWAISNAKNLDVVLYAVPPSSFLDPVSAAMAGNRWDEMSNAISDLSLPGPKATQFGAPLNGSVFNQMTAGWSDQERGTLGSFTSLVNRWLQARAQVQKIVQAGVGVVMPAGDLGPKPQTILGLANLPEVVTVGGWNGQDVSAGSASGPSMDGHVKPDLVAPTGMIGLLPPSSQLATALGKSNLLNASLEPAWSAGEPQTTARAQLDTTITSAAVVAAAMAGMGLQGVRDVSRQRGALTAASVPASGVPVWRQGDGVLHRTPDAAFASSRPLVTSHGDLGIEPDAAGSSAWTAAVSVAQGTVAGASTAITDFMGIDPTGKGYATTTDASSAPPVSASVSNNGVTMSLPLGSNSYHGGLYCGYTQVSLPGTSGTVSPTVDAYGIPVGTDQVPTCLVKGTQLDALGFYIHQLPAENLTYGLLPALPVGESVLDHVLMLLPVNPLDTRLFFKVTGTDGYAHFPNIPPGYYKIKQWSDYGDPVTQSVVDDATGQAVSQTTDIGENPGYQSIEAFVLSAFCNDTPVDQQEFSPCTRQFLESTFGAQNVQFEKSSGGWLVTIGPVTERFLFSFVKHMPGPSVSSRYVDLLKQSDFTYLTATLYDALRIGSLDRLAPSAPAWLFSPSPTNAQSMQAVFNPLAADAGGGTQYGVAKYPFNITTPNYKAHMSLNFSYDLTNSAILVVVQMGNEFSIGVVTSMGVVQLPPIGINEPINLSGLKLSGHGNGQANFEFHMKPLGASQGTLYMIVVPPVPTPLSSATIGDMSFELDTWTNTLWPALAYPTGLLNLNPNYVSTGHSFEISSNYSARQMGDGCRLVDNGKQHANVCEDWTVLVHSPLDNAATFDTVNDATGTSILPTLQAAGATYFNPHRATADFSQLLAFNAPSIALLQANLSLPMDFKTNGRFWEQLVLPRGALALYPGALTVRIQDLSPGRNAGNLAHVDGAVPVAPYVPFIDSAVFTAP